MFITGGELPKTHQIALCTRKKKSSFTGEKFNYKIDDVILYKHNLVKKIEQQKDKSAVKFKMPKISKQSQKLLNQKY